MYYQFKNIAYSYILFALISFSCSSRQESSFIVDGLDEPVEVLRDQWGINHIYAKNQHDLFFTQGYCAAKDRLFQFEIWRRQATGTVAEILGPRELKRDIGTRLFKFRGDMKTEMNYYHSEGEQIITAYVNGVNTYIHEVKDNPDKLPVEFNLLGIQPEEWTPEVVISRHQGLLGNITEELNIGRAVAKVGEEMVRELMWFHPRDPIIALDPAVDGNLLDNNIMELYHAFRKTVEFLPSDIIIDSIRQDLKNDLSSLLNNQIYLPILQDDYSFMGSNNWVINGDLMESGHPLMANDPHRTIAVPSLRYMVHLVAPGWNVIGGGEPEIPGVSIGHNEYGAWGLTVFRTDGEDLCVYDLNPANLHEYRYLNDWVEMSVIYETIKVKNSEEVDVTLRYTRHGPLVYIDSTNYKAYAVKCAWLEPGGSPYLASLRMDQAKTWEEFREACHYSHIPGENMVWADKSGNIGWQAVGIAPIRRNFSGLVPVPGNGDYEWDGFLPIKDKPHLSNPDEGFFVTANQNVTPESYEHWEAIGFTWSDPYRGDRINEVLGSGKKFSMEDMKMLQTDYFSIPARTLVPFLNALSLESEKAIQAREILLDWDFVLDRNSISAGIYVAWEDQIRENANNEFVPDEIRDLISPQLTTIINWLVHPDQQFGPDPEKGRDAFLRNAFIQSIEKLEVSLGDDINNWQYGQEKYKHVHIQHQLSDPVSDIWKEKLNIGPAPRGGNGYTPGSTGNNNNQTSGASFRIIVDTGDWDSAIATNTPGQSGDPDSPFYRNLFDLWANDEYFPLYYTKEKIETAVAEKVLLQPVN